MTTVPRGKIIGKRIDGEPTNEAEHFIQCPACRDLGQVLEHEGPLPHPAHDKAQ